MSNFQCQCHAEKSVDKHSPLSAKLTHRLYLTAISLSLSISDSFFLSLSTKSADSDSQPGYSLAFIICNQSDILLRHVCDVFSSYQHSFVFFRDVLPFTLKLPEAIASAKTLTDLEEVAKLGKGEVFFSMHECLLPKSLFY